MENYLILGIVILSALLIGLFLGKLWIAPQYRSVQNILEKQSEQLEKEVEEKIVETEKYREQIQQLRTELVQSKAKFENLNQKSEEQKAEVEKLQEKFTKEFENLANRILDQKSEKFTLQNKENLKNILDPLQEKIKNFEEKVDKNSSEFTKRHSELGMHLRLLHEQNLKISDEANNLTKALKGESKTQGNWGELILERVLEKSGLVKNREYFVQTNLKDSEGNRFLPDVVIHLPNNRKMIIDSKVSLRSYEKYVNEENEVEKSRYLKEHIKALQNHIIQLSNKKYEDLYKNNSPDFVLMFVPVEPALYLAQNIDNSFFYSAFQKNILLVSPTTLLSTLRTIDTLWSNEKQQQNAQEIAKHAASLYHKFTLLLEDLETVGNRLNSTSKAYQDSMKKLTGKQNLISDIDKLEKFGISPKKKISQKWVEKANLLSNTETN